MSRRLHTTWFFRRGTLPRTATKEERDANRTKFYKWLDEQFTLASRPNLLVYPEGHRMYDSPKPGELKDGMINVTVDKIVLF
jgi:hypothetical protein